MSLRKIGATVLVISLIGAAANLWAREAFPDQWGGPNIGGGMLQLLFYTGVLTGVTLIVIDLVRRRRGRARTDGGGRP
ncbi:hypothetical protein OHA21_17080 [Actinoplanes sp. NBC_00393]|uniref:hypothetical protein n=1 Tax=Actinoplanes sp. NBC_00393 TaxID=2975953 RepID=UPI002E1D2B1E